jgi:ribosomal protein S18 acetylase RimI-like enzyme
MTFPSTVAIQRLAPADWSVLRVLRLNALRDSPQAFLGDLGRENARSPAEWRLLAQERDWFAAICQGRPVGLASSVRDPETDHRSVESLWVETGFRDRGIATALLEAVERLVIQEGKALLRLWVLEGNAAAAETYRRYGFRESGERQPVPGHPQLLETQFVLTVPSRRITAAVPPLSVGR